jgi:hypothetical protein
MTEMSMELLGAAEKMVRSDESLAKHGFLAVTEHALSQMALARA